MGTTLVSVVPTTIQWKVVLVTISWQSKVVLVDIVAGDLVEIHFIALLPSPESITSLETSIGGNDNITLGEGNNIGIGGASNDHITSGSGRDIVAGDSVSIYFSTADALATNMVSLDPSIGGYDIMDLGDGNNVGIGVAYDDTIECGIWLRSCGRRLG